MKNSAYASAAEVRGHQIYYSNVSHLAFCQAFGKERKERKERGGEKKEEGTFSLLPSLSLLSYNELNKTDQQTKQEKLQEYLWCVRVCVCVWCVASLLPTDHFMFTNSLGLFLTSTKSKNFPLKTWISRHVKRVFIAGIS